MQTHHVRRSHRTGRNVGMHVVCDIGGRTAGGQICVIPQIDALAFLRDGVGLKALAAQAAAGNIVKSDFGQRGGMTVAPARVGIDHVHQLGHGVHAVTDDFGGVAPRCGHQFVTHHQQAKVVARQIALYQHGVTKLGGYRIGRAQVRLAQDVDRHALALVAVQGLDDHGQADVLRGFPGVVRVTYRAAAWHRHARGMQQTLA